jgi:hypothetical protein
VTRAAVVIGVLLGLAAPLAAQEAGVTPGARLRVTLAPGADRVTGTLQRLTRDSLWLLADGDGERALPLAPGTTVELGRRGTRALSGALVGLAVGTALTVGFLSQFCGGDNLCDGDEEVRAAVILGLPPVVLGVGIGALIRTERWMPIAVERLHIGLVLPR